MAARAMVLFGATGDLARKKIAPALARLRRDGRLDPDIAVVGFGRTAWDDDAFRAHWREALTPPPEGVTEGTVDECLARCRYVAGAYDDPEALKRAATAAEGRGGIVWYAALPSDVTEKLLVAMDAAGVAGPEDVFLTEKPFGRDAAGAERLNALLARMFGEDRIVRLDHYLAKDTVRNLAVFRFGNLLFEPVWNRHYVDAIRVTAAETIGCAGRGGYYDGAGVVRDMLQNHVLLMLALVLMEPPRAGDDEAERDALAEALKALRPPAPDEFVLGQYEGYRDEPGVAPESATPTYAAVKLRAANWRWEGVPIFLRAGKCLPERVSEIEIVFKRVPLCLLPGDACARLEPNRLVFRIQPDEGVSLSFAVQAPDADRRTTTSALSFRYADLSGGHALPGGYERVLRDAFQGGGGGWRGDAVEAAWRVVAPLLDAPGEKVSPYPPGAWGPVVRAGPAFPQA